MLGRSDQHARDWVARAKEFYQEVGKAAALAEFSRRLGPFVEDEMYIFVLSLKGTFLSHGADEKYIGEDFSNTTDYDGKRFIVEIIEAANSHGSGFVEYKWPDPVTKEIVPKRLYFEKIDNVIICSGTYQKMWEKQY